MAQLLIEQRNYSHILTYVFKAEAALDVASGVQASSGGDGPQQLHKKVNPAMSAERAKVQTRLNVASALAFLGQANYEKAAVTFLNLGPAKDLEDWNGMVSMIL